MRMQLNEEDKNHNLQYLSDMFSEIPLPILTSICECYNWKIEQCIDHLIRTSSESESGATISSNDTSHVFSSLCRPTLRGYNGAIPKSEEFITTSKKDNDKFIQIPQYFNNSNILNDIGIQTFQNERRIREYISKGYRVMILMRGVPGSGKSTIAKYITQKYISMINNYQLTDFILSTDDLWWNTKGQYNFCPERLGEMHKANHRRANEKAAAGWSPIIIDNTNTQLWEMLPYVQTAVKYGYILEIIEPNNSWSTSAEQLANKNTHNVPCEKIQSMLKRFEKTNVADLLKMINTSKYSVPQMRAHPPVSATKLNGIETEKQFQLISNEISQHQKDMFFPVKEVINNVTPKDQRLNLRTKTKCQGIIEKNSNKKEDKIEKNITDFYWKPYEEEFTDFWGQSKEKDSPKNPNKTLLNLLKENIEIKPVKNLDMITTVNPSLWRKHRINCPNENEMFMSLRQIYPNKDPSDLWELFVKCNGNIDWTIDILLKEDELLRDNVKTEISANSEISKDPDLICNCHENNKNLFETNDTIPNTNAIKTKNIDGIKPVRQRSKQIRQNQRRNQRIGNPNIEFKDTVENLFVIGSDHYSKHVRKILNIRNGNKEHISGVTGEELYVNAETQTDIPEDEYLENEDDCGLLEITLENSLVHQLNNVFKSDTTFMPESVKYENLKVFMPRTVAKELYMMCLESAYNQIEENRQRMLQEDEDFARLLKIPKYENYEQSPNNMHELLDRELALHIYKNDNHYLKNSSTDSGSSQLKSQTSVNLAAYLTRLKLCEGFPNIPQDTLLDVFAANGNRYIETVEMLNGKTVENNKYEQLTQGQSFIQDVSENKMLNKSERVEEFEEYMNNNVGSSKSLLQKEEAKKLALQDFEDTRNLAAHHCQLKAECYQRAKEAIQNNNGSVAVYYSQIANLHKKKIDMYNNRAANCIMTVHRYTQNNPDLLDLHYLHVLEAICSLDLFLDKHITYLRTIGRPYKHIFIITGRGLHSIGGISTIKNNVKSRLKERNLRWSEVNPGLLKVKVFSASKHCKNVVCQNI